MNWNKGAKTKGRGSSFKGALLYYLHDKERATTAERVGFVELVNLAGDDPNGAWREMMATAEAADELKRRAGVPRGGRKSEKPVYAISLEWHPDDAPDEVHMRQCAHEVLKLLNLQDHQAVIVQHTDTAHPHIHLTVNLVHPETGKTAGLSNDGYKLERWADKYELSMGVTRSPERRAKFAALDAGLKPARKPKTPKRFQEPDTKPANDDVPMRDRAAAIRDQQRAYAARLKATQDEAWKRRKQDDRALWTDYRTARQAVTARHKFQIDQIYRHKRNRDALPLSIQGFRDWKETREWKALMARLKADKRRFEFRERTLLGFVGNAIALTRPGMQRSGKGLMPMLFNLLVSGKARREIMTARHALATRALSDRQFGKRKTRADRVKIIRDAQMQALAHAYDIQKAALELRHAQEIAAQKQEWRALSADRKKLWDEWRQEFGVRQRAQRTGTGSQGSGDNGRAPIRPKDHFPDAPNGAPADPGDVAGQSVKEQPPKPAKQFLGAGQPLRKTTPKPADSRLKAEFERGPSPAPPEPKAGWKKRRSAAERREDGSYRPRNRRGPTPRP